MVSERARVWLALGCANRIEGPEWGCHEVWPMDSRGPEWGGHDGDSMATGGPGWGGHMVWPTVSRGPSGVANIQQGPDRLERGVYV